jgi:hypothetical protein
MPEDRLRGLGVGLTVFFRFHETLSPSVDRPRSNFPADVERQITRCAFGDLCANSADLFGALLIYAP